MLGIGLLASSAAGRTSNAAERKKKVGQTKAGKQNGKHRIVIDNRERKDLTPDLSISRRFWSATKNQHTRILANDKRAIISTQDSGFMPIVRR